MSDLAPTIHIVDDDASLRVALSRLLSASGYRVATYDCAEQFLAHSPSDEPGCILLDVDMPGLNGVQLQARLAEVHVNLPIVFLTGRGDIAMSVRAIKAGAEDFLAKPVSKDDLIEAINRALVRYRALHDQQAYLQDLRDRMQSLTPREHEVFRMVVLGLLNKQIAHELGNTERTVKAHRVSVMDKMHANSLAELVLMASRLGLLDRRESPAEN